MKHVNPSFSIRSANNSYDNAQLFAEAGPTGVSLTALEGDTFKAVVVYSFPGSLSTAEQLELFDHIFTNEPLLQLRFSRSHIFWTFPQSILVPAELMNEDRNLNMLNLVFGDVETGAIRSDFLYKHNLHNVYRVPQPVIDRIANYLPVASQTHVFSAMVNREIPADDHMFAVFYSNSITIMLCRNGKLQVIQNFVYNEPEDCVFHLLNICKGFDVAQSNVNLHISGMIDAGSGLYAAIYKYFLHIQFDGLPEGYRYDEDLTAQPPHFFSHLFALASCV
jgi:Protein of unknown function (DUF3822)